MPKWMNPAVELPECEVGDRILGIVYEVIPPAKRPTHNLIILVATEDGWCCNDEVYLGYGPEHCEWWAHEKDVVRFAKWAKP